VTAPIVCAGPGCEVVIERPRWNQRFHEAPCRVAAWLELHPRTYSVGGCPNCGAPLRLMVEARPAPGAIPVGVRNGRNSTERACREPVAMTTTEAAGRAL